MVVAEQLVELQCWVCGRSFMGTGKRRNRICGGAECETARDKIDWIRRKVRKTVTKASCRYCPEERELGSHFCKRHHFRKEPCAAPGCTERVVRNEGQGGQPRHCETHRADKRTSADGVEASP